MLMHLQGRGELFLGSKKGSVLSVLLIPGLSQSPSKSSGSESNHLLIGF